MSLTVEPPSLCAPVGLVTADQENKRLTLSSQGLYRCAQLGQKQDEDTESTAPKLTLIYSPSREANTLCRDRGASSMRSIPPDSTPDARSQRRSAECTRLGMSFALQRWLLLESRESSCDWLLDCNITRRGRDGDATATPSSIDDAEDKVELVEGEALRQQIVQECVGTSLSNSMEIVSDGPDRNTQWCLCYKSVGINAAHIEDRLYNDPRIFEFIFDEHLCYDMSGDLGKLETLVDYPSQDKCKAVDLDLSATVLIS